MTTATLEPVLDAERPRAFLRALAWAIGCSLLFVVVYGACNEFTHWRAANGERIPTFYFEWERHIPLIPAFIVPYMSIDLFFFGSFFLCADRAELRTHARRIAVAILVAGLFFVLAPLHYGFERPTVQGFWGPWFSSLHAFDRPYNLAPSLHIALRSLLWVIYIRHTRGWVQWSLRVWFILIGLSTLLVMQHHVIDLLGGYVLGMMCLYLWPDPITEPPRDRGQRDLNLAGRYWLVAAVFVLAGVLLGPWGWLCVWPAFALAMVGLGYAGFGPIIFGKRNGRLPLVTRLLLGPYLIGAYLSWLVQRSKKPWVQVTPNLIVGRRLTRAEARRLIDTGVTAVVDLTAELSESPPLRRLAYLNVPMLDLTRPTAAQAQQAIEFIAGHIARGHTVYVHCALGYGRSICIVAAAMVRSGQAPDLAAAMATLSAARPRAVFDERACAAIRQAIDIP